MTPVGDRKLHAFGLAKILTREFTGWTEHYAGPIEKAWFEESHWTDDAAVAMWGRPGYYLLRANVVYPSHRYPRQALRRGWTRISEVPR